VMVIPNSGVEELGNKAHNYMQFLLRAEGVQPEAIMLIFKFEGMSTITVDTDATPEMITQMLCDAIRLMGVNGRTKLQLFGQPTNSGNEGGETMRKEYYVCDFCGTECAPGTTQGYIKIGNGKSVWFNIGYTRGQGDADLCEHCRLMLEEVLRSIVGVNEHRESA